MKIEKKSDPGAPAIASAVMSALQRHRLVAVVRSKTAEEARCTARAAADAGILFIEIALTVPGALHVIEELGVRDNLFVGAGTVLSENQAKQAIGSGARFLVSPTLELDVIPVCKDAGIPCFPGAATPTEILTAARAGADLVKIFPADLVGGPEFIRQMLGPFPDVRFMVSGGVTETNLQEYARLGVIGICLSSALLAKLLAQKGADGLIRELKGFVQLIDDGPTH